HAFRESIVGMKQRPTVMGIRCWGGTRRRVAALPLLSRPGGRPISYKGTGRTGVVRRLGITARVRCGAAEFATAQQRPGPQDRVNVELQHVPDGRNRPSTGAEGANALPLAELDTAASTAKTRLLPFLHARVTRQETTVSQRLVQPFAEADQ